LTIGTLPIQIQIQIPTQNSLPANGLNGDLEHKTAVG